MLIIVNVNIINTFALSSFHEIRPTGNIITPLDKWGKQCPGLCCWVKLLVERWPRPDPSRLLSHLPGGLPCTAVLTEVAVFPMSSLKT